MSLVKKFQEKQAKTKDAETNLTKGKVIGSVGSSSGSAKAKASGLVACRQRDTMLDKALLDTQTDLRALQSVSSKNELKRKSVIPRYQKTVADMVAAGEVHPLIFALAIWFIDIGEVGEAFELFDYCLEKGVSTPDNFHTDTRTAMAYAVRDWAEAERKAGRNISPYFGDFLKRMEEQKWDLSDKKIWARYYQIAGEMFMDAEEMEPAAAYLSKALQMGAQVKTNLNKCLKELKKDEVK
ncbi:MAG: phage terminase small subunit [Desulfovibrio sp.]